MESFWACRAGTTCLENSSCSEVTTPCPGLTCGGPGGFKSTGTGSKGKCSDNSSVTATLASTDECPYSNQSGGIYNFEWTCGSNSCTGNLNTCHIPPKCGSSKGSCSAGTSDDANPSLSADPCPALREKNKDNSEALYALRSATWNCSNDGRSIACTYSEDVTCRAPTTPQCSCVGDGGCNSDCKTQSGSYDGNACTAGESGKKTWNCVAKTGKNHRSKSCTKGTCSKPSCSCGSEGSECPGSSISTQSKTYGTKDYTGCGSGYTGYTQSVTWSCDAGTSCRSRSGCSDEIRSCTKTTSKTCTASCGSYGSYSKYANCGSGYTGAGEYRRERTCTRTNCSTYTDYDYDSRCTRVQTCTASCGSYGSY
ncbi:MAG: hypothetical protein OYG31_01245, partial [Candidatus Kaiserbacteria bacterium]|nr:hypothetical protein [Candidatus Kaiserbacteria bacterium]